MATPSQVTKFFEDNAGRISARTEPVAHNTNSGLLALTKYLSSELQRVNGRLDDLERLIRQKL